MLTETGEAILDNLRSLYVAIMDNGGEEGAELEIPNTSRVNLFGLFQDEIDTIFREVENEYDVLISDDVYAQYKHTENTRHKTNHVIKLKLAGIVLNKDCRPPSTETMIIVCQSIATEMNTVFQANTIPLFVFVTVKDFE